MTYGTSYFYSMQDAIKYYEDYNPQYKRKDTKFHPSHAIMSPEWTKRIKASNASKLVVMTKIVQDKIDAGEIHIGKPPVQSGEKAYVNHEEGRWFITDGKP